MRTKTLLLTAALSAAGVVASMAAVNSVNVVGYINVSVPVGFSFIANQLVAANDTVEKLIATPPSGTTLYSWNNGFDPNVFDQYEDGTWPRPGDKLSPGGGALIYNPTAAPFTVTFVGEVKQGSLVTDITAGYQFVSSQVPQEGGIGALGYVPTSGDIIYKWNNGFAPYVFDQYEDGLWAPEEPVLKVGESALLFAKTGNDWTRTFVVP